MTEELMLKSINEANRITFLTGAGVSTASGIPDYRSLQGVYEGLMQPEYLLSKSCLKQEPEVFYQFIKQLYHPDAKPNSVHYAMKELEKSHEIEIVSQNIDGLHDKAGSQNVVNFHGSLYDTYCMKCGQSVDTEIYLKSSSHTSCGGQLRPGIVLYEEGFTQDIINQAIQAVQKAELIVIVGTTFQVRPFCELIHYKRANAKIIVVNQTSIQLSEPYEQYQGDAVTFFEKLRVT